MARTTNTPTDSEDAYQSQTNDNAWSVRSSGSPATIRRAYSPHHPSLRRVEGMYMVHSPFTNTPETSTPGTSTTARRQLNFQRGGNTGRPSVPRSPVQRSVLRKCSTPKQQQQQQQRGRKTSNRSSARKRRRKGDDVLTRAIASSVEESPSTPTWMPFTSLRRLSLQHRQRLYQQQTALRCVGQVFEAWKRFTQHNTSHRVHGVITHTAAARSHCVNT